MFFSARDREKCGTLDMNLSINLVIESTEFNTCFIKTLMTRGTLLQGVPVHAVKQKAINEGLDPSLLE